MPTRGTKLVRISEEMYSQLKRMAMEQNRTIRETLDLALSSKSELQKTVERHQQVLEELRSKIHSLERILGQRFQQDLGQGFQREIDFSAPTQGRQKKQVRSRVPRRKDSSPASKRSRQK